MSAQTYSHEQPGLEVGHPHYPGLEVSPLGQGLELDQRDSQGLEPVPSYHEDKPAYDAGSLQPGAQNDAGWYHQDAQTYQEAPAAAPKRSKKALWIIVGLVAAVLVIIAAVVGGVLGSRASHSSSTSDDSQQTGGGGGNSNSTTNSTVLANIRPNSRLAATGWHDNGNYRIRLYYQGPDQKLRFSSFSSNETTWESPVLLTGLEYAAGNNTKLAAGLSLESLPPQFNLIYLDLHSVMRGQGFRDTIGASTQGSRLDLNDYPVTVPSTSSIGCYWPYVMSQNSDGTVKWSSYGGSNADVAWVNYTLEAHSSIGTGLVVMPASTVFSNAGGFLYRNNDNGKMETFLADRKNNETGLAWGNSVLSADIILNTTIAGFAVGRPNDSKNQTNTYGLYQDTNGTVQVIWEDDATGWKGPSTYDAFNDADQGTDIACVTAAAWADATLQTNQVMNRCFFQVGGKVREVYYDGTNWQDEGYLPIT